MARAAVFLDRDGVINENVFYPDTGEVEAPRTLEDYRIVPGALEAMRHLQQAGFLLFLVSNQPNQAKRKATRADHDAIHRRLVYALDQASVTLTEAFYCFHHPMGIEPSLRGACECRKPSPHFLMKAGERHSLDFTQSWMVGDRDADIECGKAAGVRTIRISGAGEKVAMAGDFQAHCLSEAADIILRR